MRFNVHPSRRARWGPIAVLLAAVCVFGTAATRSAAHSIIPTLKGVFPLGGGVYAWVYSLNLDGSSTAQPGDYFEQADLDNALAHINGVDLTTTPNTSWGIGAATDMAVGWSATWLPAPIPVLNPAGPPPVTVTPGFNKLTWAAEVQWLGGVNVNGPMYLGDYAFKSLSDGTKWKKGGYASQDHNQFDGSLQGNLGSIKVPGPVPVSGAHTAVIGLFGSTLFLLRMRKRA